MRPLGRLLTGAALLMLLAVSNVGAITVSGTLASGSWSAADNPVRVTGDLLLPAGARLDIGPGVRVEFAGPYSFTVRGLLNAAGTRGSRIVFTNETAGVDSLRWKGIRFIQAERGCTVSYTSLSGGWARGDWPMNCGGAIYIESCSPTIYGAELVDCRADADGGAVYTWFSTAVIQNSVIAGNRAEGFGGGVFTAYSSPSLINCTVAFDTAHGWGGGVFAGSEGKPVILNSIVSLNLHELRGGDLPPGDAFSPNLARAQSGAPEVSYSNVGIVPLIAYPGAGNISADPAFVSAAPPYDFHLQLTSPSIDAGDPKYNANLEPDVLVNRIDQGAYGGTPEASRSLPVIDISLNSFNWERIRLNSQTPKEVRISNLGHYKLYLRDFFFSSAAFFPDSSEVDGVLMPSYLAAPIEPGEQSKFTIFFRPDRLGDFRETLTIVSTDTTSSRPVINLIGTGIDPVGVLEDTLMFGRVQIGASLRKSIWVKNTGRSSLAVEFGGLQNEGYTVDVRDDNVAPGDSGEIRITFAPTRPEVFEDNATITTNETNRNLYVYLQGRGYGPKSAPLDTGRFMGYVYFGGDTVSGRFGVRNSGDEELHITAANVSIPTAFSAPLPVGGIRIAPLDTGYIDVRFHPDQANRRFEANLILASNYPKADTIELSGFGMGEPGRYMFGHVSGVWDWGVSARDFIILDSVYVPAHQKLKIEAGARILFRSGASFIVDGELRAIGQPDDSIWFLPVNQSGTEASRWKGLYLSNEDGSRLSYCVVKDSREGIRISEASPIIQFSTIANNGDSAGFVGSRLGGGIYLENSGALINGSLIERNRARRGGGVYAVNSKPRISNCRIVRNSADLGGAVMMKFLSGGELQSNVIAHNSSASGVGGVLLDDRSAPRIVNNTIVDNEGAGVSSRLRSLPALINTIVWNNGSAVELVSSGSALISYSDLQDSVGGSSNRRLDPLFDPASGETYALLSNSPLIDLGSPEAGFNDYYFPPSQGTRRNDMGAYGGPLGGSWESPDLSISLIQNSAFPSWIDVVLSGLEAFTAAPICSLQGADGVMQPVGMGRSSDYIYHGTAEAEEGRLFLTASATFAGGRTLTVGRTFELRLAEPTENGTLIAGIGRLTLPGDAAGRALLIEMHSGVGKPTDDFTPVSAPFILEGAALAGGFGAKLRIADEILDGSGVDPRRLALFREENGGWIKADRSGDGFEVDGSGRYIIALTDSPEQGKRIVPESPLLLTAYPNPFNGEVRLEFETEAGVAADLALFDLGGRLVAQWEFPAGTGRHSAVWSAGGSDGEAAPAGVYWARLAAGGETRTIKLLLVR